MNSSHGRFSGKVRRTAALVCGVAAVAALAACDSKPEGQVVAVVNGDEITAPELNGELAGVQSLQDQDQATRNAALNQVVERRLLAQIAREDGIESSPDYILRRKRLEESLLAQMLNEKVTREVQEPSAQDIDQMIADNPQAFRDRTLFALDQIVFPTPERNDVIQALAPTKTMDEVVAVLNRFGVRFQRGNATIDSATLPQELFTEFRRVGTSEPMIIPAGPTITVARILATRPAPVTGAAARPIASQAFVRREATKNLQARLAEARENAEIEYQSGFAAPGAAASPGAAATSAASPAPAGARSAAPTPAPVAAP